MKILTLILGNLIILSIGILIRFFYRKYYLKEKDVLFQKILKKKQKNKSSDLESFENEISSRVLGWLFVVLVAILLWFLSSNKII